VDDGPDLEAAADGDPGHGAAAASFGIDAGMDIGKSDLNWLNYLASLILTIGIYITFPGAVISRLISKKG
jgi:hypothetical protein